MSVRCFVAVEIGDDPTLDALQTAQRRLEATGADLKCVERENIHVTLRFLGDVREGRVGEISGLVSGMGFEPFRAEVRGVGVFPNLKRPRVVWVGTTEGAIELQQIHGELEERLGGVGFTPDRRPWEPHITICRVRSGRNRERLQSEVMALADEPFGGFEVCSIQLKKSILTSRGPIYTTLAESGAIE